ncbi:MAG TPA: beta-eliminating lyase-related protein [Dongiaceae bacterium]|jgi:threonine aldolase|nr:beta-eliminating lyase-related protein [Dongiaceae bacterium]
MNFSSDTVVPVAPAIMAALAEANRGASPSYGADELSARLERMAADIFERPVAVFPVGTGTACNALALSAMTPPYGAVLCQAEAHIAVDECGAPEFYTGGAKLIGVAGTDGKLAPADLAPFLTQRRADNVHAAQPAVFSIAQASELGRCYSPAEIGALAEAAHQAGLLVHMDGARFANAMAHLGCSPAEASWRAGVDMLSLGATKNGAMNAELVVCFRPELAASLKYRRKRAGHLFAKMRYVSAQLVAYFTDDLWLHHAAQANRMAAQLAAGIAKIPEARLLYPVEANELFLHLPPALVAALRQEGAAFYDWPGREAGTFRLVTSYVTTAEDVASFLAALAKVAGGAVQARRGFVEDKTVQTAVQEI